MKRIDDFVASLGFKPLGKMWKEISTREAVLVATLILHRDTAYSAKIMEFDRAYALATSFTNLFTLDPHFYTNGLYSSLSLKALRNGLSPLPWSGNSISESTMDHGIVCKDANVMGILWVEDED